MALVIGYKKTAAIIVSLFLVVIMYSIFNEMTLNSDMVFSMNNLKEKFKQMQNSLNLAIEKQDIVEGKENKMNIVPCNVSPLIDIEDFFNYGKKPNIECSDMREIGLRKGKTDGSKFVCFDERFKFKSNNCVILSFGLDGNWDFENDVSKYGCKVYGFDPTIDINSKRYKDWERNFEFYDLGLSNKNGEMKIGKKLSKVARYETIVSMLGLNNTEIDYFKIDIEGSEISFLDDVLKNSLPLLRNIKQIGMEIHPGRAPGNNNSLKETRFGSFWREIQQLECEGFRLAHYEMNRVKTNHYKFKTRTESGCYEVLWIRK